MKTRTFVVVTSTPADTTRTMTTMGLILHHTSAVNENVFDRLFLDGEIISHHDDVDDIDIIDCIGVICFCMSYMTSHVENHFSFYSSVEDAAFNKYVIKLSQSC
jgi:hypothetical protein